ncbi:cation:proton antiporter subunit C [Aestuariibacter halophilus]|uniref:Cation:proton antiporter subunit C n=1 Tax=Fluctibacter halophilus TaxID=226011 RepID=A0ABS8G7Z3_9ALTE|nr:cation:proton antiporter subunit C [Aestuariibacter halophilus]MCC2616271.1 cation:proton antiporter subunit C [Aestuariibacter halophilus]
MTDYILGHINYWIIVLLMMIGLYTMMSMPNLVKKMAGMSVFQTGVILLYISLGKVEGGTAPIIDDGYVLYANPLPQVLMLTAIVVGVATTALGFALIVRIKEAYGTLEEDEIAAMDDSE